MQEINEEVRNLDNAASSEATGDVYVSGFALSGEYVKTLADKSFEIVGQKTVIYDGNKKVVLSVKLADETVLDYYPNKTSQKIVIGARGFKLNDWIGFKGVFMNALQMVGQMKREVIYIEGGK